MYSKIGIIREGKTPPDKRVALTPAQCLEVMMRYPGTDVVVQRSPVRAISDAEYEAAGVRLTDDVSDRDLLIGVKEVPVDMLHEGLSYQFFSHTIKQQPHNRKLLQAALAKRIRLIDHELLTDRKGERVLAFGKWAGVVGAYNAFRAWQATLGGPFLKPAHLCHDRAEMEQHLHAFPLPKDLRVVMTGGGRVGRGAMEVLDKAGLARVSPSAFLNAVFDGPVYTVLGSADLYRREDGKPFDKAAFHTDPSGHVADLMPFILKANLFMACHFWDPRGPKILTSEMLRTPGQALRVVADMSCDVGGPIDSTLRASTIAEPLYGYLPHSNAECGVGTPGSITVMAVDNLPCELPRDASEAFGRDLVDHVIPHLVHADAEGMIERATIVEQGRLNDRYAYLSAYASKEP
jgi:saccharopine dehydrogenase (NAD+, L-lysine-forming)